MLYISDTSTDPYFNLAEEEFLLKNSQQEIFRLWRNSPSIIVGQYQNTVAEIDTEYTKANEIPVVRRLTGGGAVFHDLGNINFTFIQNIDSGKNSMSLDTSEMFRRFTTPIIDALQSIGVNARLQGRNDLTIDGLKFSGNAICVHRKRILMHGTLMFSVSTRNLGRALKSRPEKFIGKAVKSNVTRVTNISTHLTEEGILRNPIAKACLEKRFRGENTLSDADVLWFKDFIGEYICSKFKDITPYSFTQEEIQQIESLKTSRYQTDSWNYGKSPAYTFSSIKRFPKGIVELYLKTEDGVIREIEIKGDYFFTRPTEEFLKELTGLPHKREDIEKKVGTLDIGAYFAGIEPEDIVSLFF